MVYIYLLEVFLVLSSELEGGRNVISVPFCPLFCGSGLIGPLRLNKLWLFA